jgi:tetratricopeptide (TPR) repeat protein
MPRRKIASIVCISLAAALARGAAQTPDPLASLDRTVALAEESLRANERQIAESRYRSALLLGWMILGGLHASGGQLAEARQAFEEASRSAVENGAALQSLAVVQLQMGDTAPALEILTRLVSESPKNGEIRRMLADALIAAGKPGEALQELDEARSIAADDPEVLFALASAYLQLKKPDVAESLFAQVAEARRLPQTHVLIGRTYRDFEYYDLARAALKRALAMDPSTRRAHYYLGTTALMEEGVVRLDEAITEFRRELKVSPNDPATTLRLGMALVEARRAAEALPLLETAARAQPPPAEALLYLGRAQLAVKRSADAVVTLKRALDAATPRGTPTATQQAQLRSIHYQLSTALRETGAAREAEAEFQAAQRLSAERAATEREQLRLYMRDTPDPAGSAESASRDNPRSAGSAESASRENPRSAGSAESASRENPRDRRPVKPALPLDAAGFDAIPPAERAALESRVRTTLTRTYLNLGIMLAQANRFSRAAEILEKAAAIDPAFPQVQ